MYRAVTLYALEHGAIVSGIVDEEKVIALLDDISIDFRFNPERARATSTSMATGRRDASARSK